MMNALPSTASFEGARPPPEQAWLKLVQGRVESLLAELLELPEETRLDGRWSWTLEQVRQYSLRPAKRVRPALVLAGYCLARGAMVVPAGLWRFAAGLELLHTYMLIQDDVADQAALRRGGPALHHLLAQGRAGEDQAVVVGSHLFALSLEAMLGSGLAEATRVSQYYLSVCRHTAVGQYLDLELSRLPLSQVSLARTLRVAHLKTARYSFSAPLACGALLAGGEQLRQRLEQVGRLTGLAFQLRDDLLGLFGDPRLSGKPVDGDFTQGKRTFPVLAAYVRASSAVQREMEALWALPAEQRGEAELARARSLVDEYGGRAATERMVERASRAARRALESLPNTAGMRDLLEALVLWLAHRQA
jgi:geranylgeranyl diphosphate synthase, type I